MSKVVLQHNREFQVEVEDLHVQVIGREKRAPHWGVQSRFRVIPYYTSKSGIWLVIS